MTQETDLTNEGNPIDATPEAPGENLGGDITTSIPQNAAMPGTTEGILGTPVTAPAIVVPPATKHVMFKRFEEFVSDGEKTLSEIWHWIEKEYHKVI